MIAGEDELRSAADGIIGHKKLVSRLCATQLRPQIILATSRPITTDSYRSRYLRPHRIRLAHPNRICDQKPHRLGSAAVAAHAIKAGLILEALSGNDDVVGIVIERR